MGLDIATVQTVDDELVEAFGRLLPQLSRSAAALDAAALRGRARRDLPQQHSIATVRRMADPLRPTLMTKMRATLAKERDAMVLEALRAAGKAAYDELLAADQARERLAADGQSPWDASPATGSLMLAGWNAFMLQTLGEQFLDAD